MHMLICCDENIREAKEAFSTLGEARLFAGRPLDLDLVKDAEALIVRSVTRVDAALLDQMKNLRFVCTATSGEEHVDKVELEKRGIAYAAARGSNAVSVAEWVVSVLLLHCKRNKASLQGQKLGIVGVGEVGSRVAEFARALGMEPVLCDPPRAEREPEFKSASLEEALACPFVTLHPSLSKEGKNASYHLIDEERLYLIPEGAVLIQASRGAVIDSAPLKRRLMQDRDLDFYADVWEGEPLPDKDILCCAQIATPHIAGYSWDGKLRGTEMAYRALSQFLKRPEAYRPDYLKGGTVDIALAGLSGQEALCKAVTALYDPEEDDTMMCETLDMGDTARKEFFDQLRKKYRKRLEFSHGLVKGASLEDRPVLKALGFNLAD